MNNQIKAGFLFIGQSPRPDVMDELRPELGRGVVPVEYGALDGIGPDAVAAMAPECGSEALVSRMADGSEVRIGERAVRIRLREKLVEAHGAGCALCAILCTGSFDDLESPVPLITSDEVFHRGQRFPDGVKTIGVIVPLREQIETFLPLWTGYGKKVLMGCASPYGDPETIRKEALRLRDLGADCLCLDCMGFTAELGRRLQALTGLEVRVPRMEIAAKIRTMISR